MMNIKDNKENKWRNDRKKWKSIRREWEGPPRRYAERIEEVKKSIGLFQWVKFAI